MDVLEKKHEKKKAVRARNKRDWNIFNQLQQFAREAERIESLEESMKTAAPAPQEEQLWSERTAEIRNRLTNKKRAAESRWQSFQGGSGGRGL